MPNPPEQPIPSKSWALKIPTFRPPSLTSKSSLSFQVRGLKVWIQRASSLAKNATFGLIHILSNVWEMRNESFYKADIPDETSATSNISGPRQNIKNWSVDFVPLIWELFLPIFSYIASKLWKKIEVTDRHFLPTQALLKNFNSPSGLTSLHSLGLWGINLLK